ncbi:MAG: hypothetical protein JSU68_14435 [Phycisphaerales bacterium]|nr:MAG: hypothetical protein JSU68_14435 [Phycisphaerales bacterium]
MTISLAADGRLLVNPVGQGPRVYFKDPKQVVTLPLLPPNQWDKAFPPYYRLNGDAWFLGDVLFYGRYAYVGHYLIGFVRFAPNRACIVEQRLVAEVMDDPGQTVDNVDGARFASPAPVRVGDYVFWRNRGDATADPPWKEQRTWIVDLEQARLCDIRELDNGFVNQQRDKLRAFLSDGGPNKPDAGDDK